MAHTMESGGAEAAVHAPAVAPPDRRRWVALAVLSVAQLMLILDVTVVNVALPDIGRDLQLHRTTLTWVLTAYTVAFGGLMLLGGRLSDLIGARRTALAGLALFTAASSTAGLAGGSALLITSRAAQGVGAALLSPSALALLTTTFHGPERTRALGVWSALGGIGAALGVLFGGVLTSGPGWRWVFYVNVPTGLVLLAALPVFVPAVRPSAGRRRLDLPGAVLVTAATGAAIFAMINAGDHGWGARSTLLPLVASAVAYSAFYAVERLVRTPLLDIRILSQRPVLTGGLLILTATGLLVGSFFLGSFYLQYVRGFGALAAGLAFFPVAVGTMGGAHTGSLSLARFGPRAVAVVALGVAACGSAAPALWSGPAALIAGISVAAAGLGATFVVAFATGLSHVDPEHAGTASGVINSFHELGGAAGVAVLSTIAGASLAAGGGSDGFGRAFAFSAVAAAVAAAVCAVAIPAGRPPAGAVRHGH
jgi:EmrB/QacA subfamily drug resistance transporter